jgi:hypothetical protein
LRPNPLSGVKSFIRPTTNANTLDDRCHGRAPLNRIQRPTLCAIKRSYTSPKAAAGRVLRYLPLPSILITAELPVFLLR